MREIPLIGKKGSGMVALVDDEEFARVSCHKWHVMFNHDVIYARANYCIDGKYSSIYLHRFILELLGSKMLVDHINHNGLDCRKTNMRICSVAQNQHNRLPNNGHSSAFKGVSWNKGCMKWSAQICKFGKHHLGYFKDEVDAARAYDKKAKELFGEFAHTNF